MDNLLQEFLIESHENLDQLDQDLVSLEEDPSNPEILSRVFRTIHTLKGSCGFLGFMTLESVAHVGENLLSRFRDGSLQMDADATTGLLSLVDAVRQMLANIETTEQEGDADYSKLIETLTRLQNVAGPETQLKKAAGGKKKSISGKGEPRTVTDSEEKKGEVMVAELAPGMEESLVESYRVLDELDQVLATLEEQGAGSPSPEVLWQVSDSIERLRDACSSLDSGTLDSVTRAGGNFVGRLRGGTMELNGEITEALLPLVDLVRQILANIETGEGEGDTDPTRLIETLEHLDGATRGEEVEKASKTEVAQVAGDDPEPRKDVPRGASVSETNIRVDVIILDKLMDQVGELVLARNRILQFGLDQEDRSVLAAYQGLDLITTELQESVMSTRMQTIHTIWKKFPRVVRDLALECGKKVELKMEGQETELDRTLIEAIKDPLTHLVRNAVDHGIEPPDVRLRAGKAEVGTLRLRAFHEGGQVNIEIFDDGGGIDPMTVAAKAKERNLATAQELSEMNQRETLNLIFTPGFSTAEKVTSISGRGVGMDVVRSNIEEINGSVDIQSEIGVGTTIKVKIPLTLAIIPALMVRLSDDRYAIPQANLIEVVRLEGEEICKKIEMFHGAPVYRLRGDLLPLVYLNRELKLDHETTTGGQSDSVNIVVLQADEQRFGLIVESVLDTEEIVVKALGKLLNDIPIFAGATILGNGKVALILDIVGLAKRAHVITERKQAAVVKELAEMGTIEGDLHSVLLLESSSGTRLALPLARVTRLEKISRGDIEKAGHREVVQYWGQVMPLIDVSKTLGITPPAELVDDVRGDPEEEEFLEVVVVHGHEDRYMGLVVAHIIDIVEDRFAVQGLKSREEVIIGTAVVQGQVTELLDLERLIQVADPKLFDQFGFAAAVN